MICFSSEIYRIFYVEMAFTFSINILFLFPSGHGTYFTLKLPSTFSFFMESRQNKFYPCYVSCCFVFLHILHIHRDHLKIDVHMPLSHSANSATERPQNEKVRKGWEWKTCRSKIRIELPFPDRWEVGTWSTLHLASNTLLYAYITLPFGMLQLYFEVGHF